MKFRSVCIMLVVLFVFPSMGFVCATRVERMEADVSALQLQFSEIQQRINNDQTQMSEMILRADKKLEELGSTQGQTHDRVAQQNVQLGLELEKERSELASLRGRLDVQQKTIEELQQTLISVVGSISSTGAGSSVMLPSDQDGLYQFAMTKKLSGEGAQQRAAIQEFLKRYPNDSRSESLLGELVVASQSAGLDREAITHATRYLQVYPTGASRNDVIYAMGLSGLSVKNCDLAIKSFETLQALAYRDASAKLREARAACGR